MPGISKGRIPEWMVRSAPYDAMAFGIPMMYPEKVGSLLGAAERGIYAAQPSVRTVEDAVVNIAKDRLGNPLITRDYGRYLENLMKIKDVLKDYPEAFKRSVDYLRKYSSLLGE